MRYARVGVEGQERPAVLTDDGRTLDLSPLTADVDGAFLGRGVEQVRRALDAGALPELPVDGLRLGAPLARPGKIVAIGLNYRKHAQESGAPEPAEPIVFLKATTSMCGPTDPIRLLPGSTTTDWEVELGVVLGSRLTHEPDPGLALAAVAGYVTVNDVSDRDLQLNRGGTWTKGKSADSFCPVGPWLVTADEIPDPQDLGLSLWVNGTRRQHGSTSDMIFDVGTILSYLSQIMTLEPGDLVITGTPSGVAMGQPEPRPYLAHGDLVELEVAGLGRQRSTVVAHGSPAGEPGSQA